MINIGFINEGRKKINGKTYIGSFLNLSSRISNYLSRNYLKEYKYITAIFTMLCWPTTIIIFV
jgi:hypothetical protein